MRSIKNWVIATFILSFLVIIAGGVVRTTQSGMGCPDWPRCFGSWIPPTNASELPADFEKYLRKQDIDHSFNALHTWIEYINRLLGALLGVFAIIQVLLILGKRKLMPAAWRLALLFLLVVILTGIFGAIVVRLNLAHLSISVHLLFAIILLLVQLALLLTVSGKQDAIPVSNNIRKLLYAFIVIMLIQSVMGTMVRMYVDDVSKILHYEQREQWLANTPVAFLIHRSFSWIVLLMVVYIAWTGRAETAVKNKLFLLAAIISLSVVTGITLYYANMPAVAQPLHLLLASLAITQATSVLIQAKRK